MIVVILLLLHILLQYSNNTKSRFIINILYSDEFLIKEKLMMSIDDYGTLEESPSKLDCGWILSCNMMFQLKERNKTTRGER